MLSKTALSGLLQSVFMLAAFTVFWSGFMIWGFGLNPMVIMGIAAFAFYSIFAVIKGLKIRRAVGSLQEAEVSELDKKAQKSWSIIFSVQGCLIGASCAMLGIFGKYDLIVPVVAFIVGVHYFPLGALYHTRFHIAVGLFEVLISVFAIVSIALNRFVDLSIGFSALAAALGTVALSAYLLRLISIMRQC